MSDNCKDLMRAMYFDWVRYYKSKRSPRSNKKMKDAWDGWAGMTKAKKLKKNLKASCDWQLNAP